MNRYASALFTREFGFADTCRCAWQVLPKNGAYDAGLGPLFTAWPKAKHAVRAASVSFARDDSDRQRDLRGDVSFDQWHGFRARHEMLLR